jgi:molybdenum cofactor sulfurtransferase
MLPCDASGWRRAAVALLRRLVALLLALLASLTAASSPPPAHVPPVSRAEEEHAEPREAAFAASSAGAYGYAGRLARLRASEFTRLRGTAYLDHAGAALYSEAQVADAARSLARTVLGNPHSGAGASGASDAALDAARRATLAWCRAPPGEYVVVFTANATAALKLVAEAIPWRPRSRFWCVPS